MTNLNDFDHALADFLAEGPSRAPEAPVIAALAHARTTPRRPDPLRAFRSDVMARPRRIVGLRPGLVLAAVALIGASLGVAVIGSRPPGPSVVVAPTPSAPPKSPLATMPARFEKSIPLNVVAGNPFTLTVIDEGGMVVNAASGTPTTDGASVEGVDIAADPGDDRALSVTWVGMPCETRATMTVDARQRTIAIKPERCEGDSFPLDRIVRLQLNTSVRPDEWSGTIGFEPRPSQPAPPVASGEPEPIGSPAVAPVRVGLTSPAADGAYVDVVDESGRLLSAAEGDATTVAPPTDLRVANVTDTIVRLDWLGSPCDRMHRLTINSGVTELTIDRPRCSGDSMAAWRALLLTFDAPIDANALSRSIFEGRGGVGMPTFTATGPDSGSGRYDLVVDDPGDAVESIEAAFDPEVVPPAEGTRLRLDQLDPSRIRVVWRASACASTWTLSIADNGGTWTLSALACEPAGGVVLRMVDITVRNPRTVGAVAAEVVLAIP